MDYGLTLKLAFTSRFFIFFFILQGVYQVFLEMWKNLSASRIKITLNKCSVLLSERSSCFVILPNSLNGK